MAALGRVNLHPTNHVFGDKEKTAKPRPVPGSGHIEVKELHVPRMASREATLPKKMFNPSVERDARAAEANVAKANTPIPTPIWHIPGLDDAPRTPVEQCDLGLLDRVDELR